MVNDAIKDLNAAWTKD